MTTPTTSSSRDYSLLPIAQADGRECYNNESDQFSAEVLN